MIQHHPDIHWLTEFAASTLPESQALAIAAHLEFCPICRQKVDSLKALGGAMFDNIHKYTDKETNELSSVSDDLFDKTMALIDSAEQETSSINKHAQDHKEVIKIDNHTVPSVLHNVLPKNRNLQWKQLNKSLSIARLTTADSTREVALHKLSPGRSVANHDHKGCEITVVLCGSFSDQNALYHPGDFLVKHPGEDHRPTASEDMECICLSVLDAPIQFTGPLMRLINPLLRIYPNAA